MGSRSKNVKMKKSKTSSVKQRNRLRNKGKIKVKRHVRHINQRNTVDEQINPNVNQETEAEDVLDMMDKDEISFLKESISKQKYGFLKQIAFKKRERADNDAKEDEPEDVLENKYKKSQYLDPESNYNKRMLLPIKTKSGLVHRYTDITEHDEINNVEESISGSKIDAQKSRNNSEEYVWLETEGSEETTLDINKPVSFAKIYAKREDIVRKHKLRIGLLSSSLLENPEFKIGNLKHLLDIMGKRDPELQITVKKLVTVSLMEVFKDLLPAYQIKHQDVPYNKLKKDTRQLIGYEGELLKDYKIFLTKLEKLGGYLRKKRGDTRTISPQQKSLGLMAVQCLCELLTSHPYFNYSTNIVQLLTVYLDNPDPEVRKTVENCYKRLFKDDKKRLITLTIIRRINHLVKARAHSVHCEVLSVLLALPIKDVNLDKEKEEEMKNKKLMQHKKRLLSVSKRERKRRKQLAHLENEMFEAKAEENKKSKEQNMTEITKIVFLIYFRILKRAPRSNLLSVTLEGLAKFAHCINLEYYQDLMNVLDHLLEKEQLTIKEQLYCVKTVFIILSGYGDSLSIDPVHFYTHLYRILLSVNAGKHYDNVPILLSTLENVLVTRYKKLTTQRSLSFIKRLASVSCAMLHNGTLGSLSIIRSVLQLVKSSDLLLDVESTYGQGVYHPELNEPEYSNAGNTALWELCALQRHYHPVVRKSALSIAACGSGERTANMEFSTMDAMQFFDEYNPANCTFKPAVPAPNKKYNRSNTKLEIQQLNDLSGAHPKILNLVETSLDFSSIYSEK